MPVYASVPAASNGHRHPKTLALIVAAHALALAAVMSVKMEIIPIDKDPPLIRVPLPKDPPPPKPQPKVASKPWQPPVSAPPTPFPLPPLDPPTDAQPIPTPLPEPGPLPGLSTQPQPQPQPAPPVRVAARFATPPGAVEPPYPLAKRRAEEEATLRLRLSIDARGRVIAIDPVGGADPVFLDAARKHILARWRYKPATEDGRAVASSTVITLRFELEQ